LILEYLEKGFLSPVVPKLNSHSSYEENVALRRGIPKMQAQTWPWSHHLLGLILGMPQPWVYATQKLLLHFQEFDGA